MADLLRKATNVDYAAIITAIASAITAVGGVIVAFTVLIPSLRIARNTHTLVNQSHTDAINYQNALIRALKDKGIDVPVDQSAPNGGTQSDIARGSNTIGNSPGN